MGFISRLFRQSEPVQVMRLDIFLDYTIRTGQGVAATEWIPLKSDDIYLRPLLLGLLYARVLGVHGESRERLFQHINDFSMINIDNQGKTGCTFPDWRLDVGQRSAPQTIWPWDIQNEIEAQANSKVYQATLLGFVDGQGQGTFGIHLKMAFGLEKVLVPASVLVAVASYIQTSDQQACHELAILLKLINEFYGTPKAVRVGSESAALLAAMSSVGAERLASAFDWSRIRGRRI